MRAKKMKAVVTFLHARGRQLICGRQRKRLQRPAVLYLLVIGAVIFLVVMALRSDESQLAPTAAAGNKVAELPWDDAATKRTDPQLLIPRRIHHFFSTSRTIPVRHVPEINSWANNHKDCDIYYWDAGYVERTLLTERQYDRVSQYYWNGTRSRHERDLIARLVILHRFGGIAPELSMRSLRDVTEYLSDSSCVVAQDRVEKAVFTQGLEALPSLAFLACRPGHHFLTYLLRKVTEVEFRTGAVVLEVGTPVFLVHAFNAAVAAFDEECASRACDFRERVSLAEPQVFLPVIEAGLYETMTSTCKSRARLPFLQKEACYNLDANGNEPTAVSLAMPVYVESWAPNKDRPALPLVQIGPSARGKRPVRNWSWLQHRVLA